MSTFLLGNPLAIRCPWKPARLLRISPEVNSADDRDLPGGQRTLDVDTAALEQAFADFKFSFGEDSKLTLRPGRQALMFGKQRLVSPLPWGNSLRRWDGVTAIVESGGWKTSIFWTQFAPTDKHDFNSSDSDSEFWGVYGSGTVNESLQADLYYLGIDHKTATFNSTAGHEERHTVGARIEGKHGAIGFDVEAAYQFGRVGSGDVSACMLASQIGYKVDMKGKPRLYVGFDYASGDDNAGKDAAWCLCYGQDHWLACQSFLPRLSRMVSPWSRSRLCRR